MGVFARLAGGIRKMLNIGTDAQKAFDVEFITSPEMDAAIKRWGEISKGRPPWKNPEDEIDTVNMARHIADTRARLTALDIGIAISGSARADYLQSIADILIARLPDKIAEADRLGGMIIKWSGESWDFVMPGDFGITALNGNHEIVGAVFAAYAVRGDKQYTRLEYHRFEGESYVITHKAFKADVNGKGQTELGKEVPLASVDEWAELPQEVTIDGVERPLFGFYRVPGANAVDAASPLGISVFANALPELKALDIAISRKNAEVEDSKHVTFVGQAAIQTATKRGMRIPRFVKGLGIGTDDGDLKAIQEHAPTMLTDQRIKDINFDLSMAGVKCGFSEGVFVMDGQTGMITATQVEADDRDTIQTVKADRDALRVAVEQAIYGADVLTTLTRQAPLGKYDIAFNFGDITYSYEEDKANWKSYAQQGWIPKWLYFVKFEGFGEDEAKALTQEAENAAMQQPGLFTG